MAALGSFLFGFDTAVISGTTEALRLRFVLTNNQLGLTVASALLGTIVGSLGVGSPAERLGRRPVLRALAVLYFVSATGCALAWSWPSLLAFRFIGGLAIGGSSVVAPIYIAEIAPPSVRGGSWRLSQLNVVAGILVAYLSNYFVAGALGGPESPGLAHDARDSGRSSPGLLLPARGHSGEPSLAGQAPSPGRGGAESWRSSATSSPRPWSPRSRSRFTRRRSRPTSRSSRGSTGGRSSSPSWWHVQPALGHQRPHLLHRRHLPHGGGRARRRPAAIRGHRLHQPALHHDRNDGDRPLRPQAPAPGGRPRARRVPRSRLLGLQRRDRRRPRPGQPHRLHRLLRLLAGLRDLGLPLRDLPEPGAGPRAGPGQLHPLVLGRARELDASPSSPRPRAPSLSRSSPR